MLVVSSVCLFIASLLCYWGGGGVLQRREIDFVCLLRCGSEWSVTIWICIHRGDGSAQHNSSES